MPRFLLWPPRGRDGITFFRYIIIIVHHPEAREAHLNLGSTLLNSSRAPVVAAERLPAVLPVVLYNGAKPWTATRETRALVAPTEPWLAPYQPAQRYWLLDLRRVAAEDLPCRDLLRAVARLGQSRSPADMVRAVHALRRWLRYLPTCSLTPAGWLHRVVRQWQ